MTSTQSTLAVLAVGLFASGCTSAHGEAVTAPQPVKTVTVSAAAIEQSIRYSATIEPFEQVALAFKASGYVDDVMKRTGADRRLRVVQPGDRVSKGAVLARVRTNDYRERVDQGRARLTEGEASLTKARLDLDRASTLFAADSLTRPDLDAAQAAFDAARARVAAARSDVELAASALGDTSLVAPTGGVLLERRIEVGSLVSGGSVGFVLADVSLVKARFGVPDMMVGSLSPGDPIEVVIEAGAPGRFEGQVTAIAPAADPQSRVFAVEITIPNRSGLLRPGMIGTVAIGDASAPSQALVVPLSAIVRTTGDPRGYAVLVVERRGDREVATRRRVELGDVTGNGIAVTSGLEAGTRVVVTGATLLNDGDPVRVIP